MSQFLRTLDDNDITEIPAAVTYAKILIRVAGDSPVLSNQILEIMQKCPAGPESLCAFGQFYLQQNNAKKAQEYFNKAIAEDSSHVESFLGK